MKLPPKPNLIDTRFDVDNNLICPSCHYTKFNVNGRGMLKCVGCGFTGTLQVEENKDGSLDFKFKKEN